MSATKCPHCTRQFQSGEGMFNHIKAKHGLRAAIAYGEESPDAKVKHIAAKHRAKSARNAERSRRREAEPSMADLMVEAEINRAMGIRNERWIEEMLP